MNGVWGRYGYIDLSTGRVEDYGVPAYWYKKHLGGRGIGARILVEEVVRKQRNVDPFGEDNFLIFGTGPMQGTGAPGSGKHVVMGWSPKTGAANESYAGGFFGHTLAMSGYDGLIIKGSANRPCYITLIDGEIELHSAESLWGLITGECETQLKALHGDNVRVACIGPAGENLVKFACIINDRSRAAARPGFGAVMGAKKLKAIIVGGGTRRPIARLDDLQRAIRDFAHLVRTNPALQALGEYGTSSGVLGLNELGILPTRNFQEGFFSHAEDISGQKMAETILVGRDTCAGCPVRCKRVVSTNFEGEQVLEEYGGPEYETIGAFGSLCLVDDLRAIALANQKCNQYGLDTISTGVLIAFLMEATERGFFKEDSGIHWGDGKALVKYVEMIAKREKIGDFLAQGLDAVAKELGGEAFAVHIKGVEVPLHDPRGKKGLAISYATSPRGATHLEAMHDEMFEGVEVPTPEIGVVEPINRLSWDEKARLCKVYEDLYSFVDSAIICGFVSWNQAAAGKYYPFPAIRRILKAATGLGINAHEMLAIGERNYAIRKILSAYSGYNRTHDDLPPRLKAPLRGGASEGEAIPDKVLQEQINEYYDLRGFDDYGPTDQKLVQLGLPELKGLIVRSPKA